MTTLHQYTLAAKFDVSVEPEGAERRTHRRHDLEQQGIAIDRWDGNRRSGSRLRSLEANHEQFPEGGQQQRGATRGSAAGARPAPPFLIQTAGVGSSSFVPDAGGFLLCLPLLDYHRSR